MIQFDQVYPVDNRLRELVTSPCWLAFLFLGLGSDNSWFYWIIALIGIVISNYAWWILYKLLIVDGTQRNRTKFYLLVVPLQLLIAGGVVTYVWITFAI